VSLICSVANNTRRAASTLSHRAPRGVVCERSSPTEAPTQRSDNTNPPTATSLTTVRSEFRRAALG
jgi:hypothetical protein